MGLSWVHKNSCSIGFCFLSFFNTYRRCLLCKGQNSHVFPAGELHRTGAADVLRHGFHGHIPGIDQLNGVLPVLRQGQGIPGGGAGVVKAQIAVRADVGVVGGLGVGEAGGVFAGDVAPEMLQIPFIGTFIQLNISRFPKNARILRITLYSVSKRRPNFSGRLCMLYPATIRTRSRFRTWQ